MTRKGTWITLGVAILVAAIIWALLWLDFEKGRRARAEVLVTQGKAILYALNGGLRSHCRVDGRFGDRAEVVLSEIAQAAPGVLGLAIFDASGVVIAQGGKMPGNVHPSSDPQWIGGWFLICQSCDLSQPSGCPPEGRGPGWGRGRGPAGGGGPLPEEAREAAFEGTVWLSVLLDGAPYKEGVAKDKRLFVQGLALSLALVLLGSVVFPLLTRHRRLEADLRLAREREKRLKERSELGAGLAHETKNPLTLIRGLAQSQMERTGNADTAKPSGAETPQALRQIVDEVDQVVGRINSFLEYARTPSPRPVDMDLSQAVAGTVQLFRDEAAAKRVDLRQSLAPVRAAADPAMLRQVVVNLLANALAACGEGDTIEVGLGNGSVATLSVRDTGEGIAPEDVPRVREPYFSRREGGTGLGLAIVDQIVQAHGWRLDISSRPGEGTLVRILDIAISGRGAPAR